MVGSTGSYGTNYHHFLDKVDRVAAKPSDSVDPAKVRGGLWDKAKATMRIGGTLLLVPVSPLLITVGAVIFGISKAISGDKSLWDKAMTLAILPSTNKKRERSSNIENFDKFSIPQTVKQPELSAMVLLAKGMPKETAQKMPCVVLFCPNGARMDDPYMTGKAEEYSQNGYNVVLFDYRGVGDSKGFPKSCQDLLDDGLAVVNHLKQTGFELKSGIKIQPTEENLILDGHSIGGAVAAYVGKENPKAVLAAHRTFTKWTSAVDSVVSGVSNPIIGKIAKGILMMTPRSKMKTKEYIQERLNNKEHKFTIIEDAKFDQVLGSSRLTSDKVTTGSLGQTFTIANSDQHMGHIPLEDRHELMKNVITPHNENIKLLKLANELDFKPPEGISEYFKNLKKKTNPDANKTQEINNYRAKIDDEILAQLATLKDQKTLYLEDIVKIIIQKYNDSSQELVQLNEALKLEPDDDYNKNFIEVINKLTTAINEFIQEKPSADEDE